MDHKVNYTMVGLFVVVLGAAMILLAIWLSVQGRNKVYHPYLVYAQGGVTGLTVKSPVQFNGVRIGYVESIKLAPKQPKLVKITLQIEEGTPIMEGTVATLIAQGVTGIVYVGLQAEKTDQHALKAKEGQRYPVIPYKVPLLTQLGDAIPEMTDNMKEVTKSFTTVFSDANNEALSETLANMAKVSQALADNSEQISDSFVSLQKILKNTETASNRLDTTMSDVNQAAQNLSVAGAQLTKTMQSGELMLNNVDTQVLPNLYQVLQQMQRMSIDLQQFSSQIAQNPAVLLRGKSAPAAGSN